MTVYRVSSRQIASIWFSADVLMEKTIVAAPIINEPFMAVRISTDDYRVREGVAIATPHSEVVANVLISAIGEYIDADRALPEEVDAMSDYRFLPSGVGATEWLSEEANNIKFTYQSGKAPEIVERTWNSGKEVVTRTGARIDSANEEVLTSDFSILGAQDSYAVAIVFEPNRNDFNLTRQTILATTGSNSPWALVIRDTSTQLTANENPWNESNDAIVSTEGVFNHDVPNIAVVSVHESKISVYHLGVGGRVVGSAIPVDYSTPEVISLLLGTDKEHYMKYADAVVYEVDLYLGIDSSFSPTSVIHRLEEAYGIKQW